MVCMNAWSELDKLVQTEQRLCVKASSDLIEEDFFFLTAQDGIETNVMVKV